MNEGGREVTTYDPNYAGVEGSVIAAVGGASSQSGGGSRSVILSRAWLTDGANCLKPGGCWIKGMWLDTTQNLAAGTADLYWTYSVADGGNSSSYDSIWKSKSDGSAKEEGIREHIREQQLSAIIPVVCVVYKKILYEHHLSGMTMGKLTVDPLANTLYGK